VAFDQKACDRKRWLAMKADPERMAKYRARVAARAKARREADPEWHAKQKAYLRAYYQKNKEKHIASVRNWRHKNPGTRSGEHRKARYLLSADGYNQMVADQGGRCAICAEAPNGKGPLSVLHVDHDHSTGAVRSLLCQKCNTGLGCFKENTALLIKAHLYLLRHIGKRLNESA
jgi:hypothetical protein